MKIKQLLFTLVSCLCFLAFQTIHADISDFPNTDFIDLDGETHNMREYLEEGKIVVMAFWVASESSCIAKLPAIEELWQTHGPNGTNTTIILGIEGAVETADASVQAIRNSGAASYPLINTVAGCSDKPNCGNPHYYVVCPDGGGSWSYVNQSLSGESLVNHVTALINGCEVYEHDASVLDLKGFDNVICDDVVAPVFTLYNRGSETLTSADIEIQFNGAVVNTVPWTGNLAQFETEVVTLADFDAPTETGVYDLTLTAINPNGNADENTVNNTKVQPLVVIAPEYRDELALFVSPDFYPEEVQWELKTTDGIILGHGKDYTGDFLETICVERGACYEFTLYDANADGFEIGHGELFQNGCEIFSFTSDDHDGLYTSFEFCLASTFEECDELPEVVGIDAPTVQELNIYPNPATTTVNIDLQLNELSDVFVSIRDLTGKTVTKNAYTNITQTNLRLDISDLAQGVYILELGKENGVFHVEKLVVTK